MSDLLTSLANQAVSTLTGSTTTSSANGLQSAIRSALGDGARSTRFDAIFEFTNSSDFPSQSNTAVLVKSASFPGVEHQIIDLKYKGRTIPIRGQIKYSHNWECTFYLTENHQLKKGFEDWIEALDETIYYPSSTYLSSSVTTTRANHKSLSNYTKDIAIYQLDYNDTTQVAKYILHNAFPIQTSTVSVSMEGPGSVLEFTVNFAFSYFTLQNLTVNGSFVDEINNVTGSTDASSILSTLNSSITSAATLLTTSAVQDLLTGSSTTSTNFELMSSQMKTLISGQAINYVAGSLISDYSGTIISSVLSSVSSAVSSVVSSVTSTVSSWLSS